MKSDDINMKGKILMTIEVANRLLDLRKKSGMSQEELAENWVFPVNRFQNGKELNHLRIQIILLL